MISGIFIDRPRLAIVVSIVVTPAGLLAITSIPVAQFADIGRRRSRMLYVAFQRLRESVGSLLVADTEAPAAP